jgi:hypothetical protein
MVSTILEPPVGGDDSPAGNLPALTTRLAAAGRRLAWGRMAPAAPGLRDRAREAEAVRALAHTYYATDRRFADDLYAAAQRHELAADDEARPPNGLGNGRRVRIPVDGVVADL